MSRSVAARMVALVVVVILGVYYIAVDILGYRIGAQRFPVTVQAADAGGIYPGAQVTYRGVPIGLVSSLHLRTTGVDISIALNPGVKVPSDTAAHIRELSALGEQYMDLIPPGPSTSYLHAGSVIPASQVTTPVAIGTALLDLGSLLQSINPADLRTFEGFLFNGFIGTDQDLKNIVVTGQNLFQALLAAQAGTVNLVNDGLPVLQAFQATDNQFATFTHGLNEILGQLTASNSDLAQLIKNGQSAESSLNPWLSANSANLEATIASFAAAAGVAQQNQPGLQALLQVLPTVTHQLGAVVSNGQISGEVSINTANHVCAYVPGATVAGPTVSIPTSAIPLDNSCLTGASDMLQRGAGTTP